MEQKEKITQIASGSEVVYALSSEGRIFMGLQREKGFEWRGLPEINFENIGSIPSLGSGGDEAQVLSAPPGEEIQTAAVKRDDVKPEEPKPTPAAQTK